MEALTAAHEAVVQMIDTSVVRVHQHGACIAGDREQHMGRSRGGLTSKVHAVVDANGLPVRLGPTPGEAHDNRLCPALLGRTAPENGAGGSRLRRRLDQSIHRPAGYLSEHTPEGEPQGPHPLQSPPLPGA